MSVAASDSVFLSALQPNTSVTTYGFPTDMKPGDGSSVLDEMARVRRVQQQVQMRLAEKSTLPRQNGSTSQYAMSDYGGSSQIKYHTYKPSFSSKSSYLYSASKTMGPRVSQRSGFSSQSVGPDMAQYHRVSVGGGGVGVGGGGGGGGGSLYREDIHMGGYQGNIRPQSRMDSDTLSMHAVRQHTVQANPWVADCSDAGSLVSDRDATFGQQYSRSTINGYNSQVRQGGGVMTFPPPMRQSLSGSYSRGGGMTGGEAEIIQQHSYKGPAHRTISRITNRNRMSMGSMSGTLQHQMSSGGSSYGGDRVDRGFIASAVSSGSQGNLLMQRQGTLSRAMSIKSMQSVGRGVDIYDGQMEMGASMGNLSGISSLDIPTAVQYLREDDPELQALGAAYIQHECYNDRDAKDELVEVVFSSEDVSSAERVRNLKGIGDLVKLFTSNNVELQCFSTAATRNLIYENTDNKVVLIAENGISKLVEALKTTNNDELHKSITGIMWNLSSKDQLKEKLATETISELTESILIPLSGGKDSDSESFVQTSSQAEIFYNTTGCLRNVSSANGKVRQQMRETHGLVDSLVGYIKAALNNDKADDKAVENSVCVLRNLSFLIYNEMPTSIQMRLEGPTRAQGSGKGEAIGCFTPQSRKAKNSQNQDLSTFTEVARVPKKMEWLWHPQIVKVYKQVLQQCNSNAITREAAAGALQNITTGDKRWASVLSRVALEQENMMPLLLDLLRTNNDLELCSLTGILRNLSRHAKDKSDFASKVVNPLVLKLPDDVNQKEPSADAVVNICGVLNNLVISSSVAAKEITFFDGLQKLFGIKNSRDNSPQKAKVASAAATVLSNMFQYKKLHKQYTSKGFTKADFLDSPI